MCVFVIAFSSRHACVSLLGHLVTVYSKKSQRIASSHVVVNRNSSWFFEMNNLVDRVSKCSVALVYVILEPAGNL